MVKVSVYLDRCVFVMELEEILFPLKCTQSPLSAAVVCARVFKFTDKCHSVLGRRLGNTKFKTENLTCFEFSVFFWSHIPRRSGFKKKYDYNQYLNHKVLIELSDGILLLHIVKSSWPSVGIQRASSQIVAYFIVFLELFLIWDDGGLSKSSFLCC